MGEKIVPNFEFWKNMVSAIVFHNGSKRLVEPEVIPPFHGDEVAKPLVREFVSDGECDRFLGGKRRIFGAKQLRLAIGNKTPVFHGARLKVRNSNLVELLEWIGRLEEIFVILERFDGDRGGEFERVWGLVEWGVGADERAGFGLFLQIVKFADGEG